MDAERMLVCHPVHDSPCRIRPLTVCSVIMHVGMEMVYYTHKKLRICYDVAVARGNVWLPGTTTYNNGSFRSHNAVQYTEYALCSKMRDVTHVGEVSFQH